MGRKPLRSKKEEKEEEGMKKRGAWTAEEDSILSLYIHSHGEGKWNSLPRRAGLKRCGKSCRLRWLNYLRPNIKRGNISPDEEDLIIRLHKLLGNRWSMIAGRLPGRTDNEIKNYWNTTLYKKLMEAEAASNKQQHTKPNLDSQKPAPMKTATFSSIQVDHRHLLSLPPQDDLQFMDETSPHVNFNDDTLSMNLMSFHEMCLPGVGGSHGGGDEYLLVNTKQVVQEEGGAGDDGYGVIQQQQQQMIGNEVADDFNFIAELLDYEVGWLGNF